MSHVKFILPLGIMEPLEMSPPDPQLSHNQPRLFTALLLVFGMEPQPSLLLLILLKDPGGKWRI